LHYIEGLFYRFFFALGERENASKHDGRKTRLPEFHRRPLADRRVGSIQHYFSSYRAGDWGGVGAEAGADRQCYSRGGGSPTILGGFADQRTQSGFVQFAPDSDARSRRDFAFEEFGMRQNVRGRPRGFAQRH